ncbi:hypothetical protein [Pseudoalteromonas rubra]|uniref:hypothetical protein n=1 Tax=Pseudoalteromonas rubra TaxID=43658 RepID=UPI000AFC565C|nr:hypothetical protein [Pseudoalteromonas rubra]
MNHLNLKTKKLKNLTSNETLAKQATRFIAGGSSHTNVCINSVQQCRTDGTDGMPG